MLAKKYDLHIRGVIHVGAHLAEEADLYDRLSIPRVTWIEANPEVIPQIQEVLNRYKRQYIQQALVLGAKAYRVPFHVTNYNGMSSSVYNWGTHTNFSPDTVVEKTIELDAVTLDSLFVSTLRTFPPRNPHRPFNLLNIDVEGAGLGVLQGGTGILEHIDYLYIEVQTDNVYDGAPLLPEYDAFLDRDFQRVELGMVEGQGWGDAFYLRRSPG